MWGEFYQAKTHSSVRDCYEIRLHVSEYSSNPSPIYTLSVYGDHYMTGQRNYYIHG